MAELSLTNHLRSVESSPCKRRYTYNSADPNLKQISQCARFFFSSDGSSASGAHVWIEEGGGLIFCPLMLDSLCLVFSLCLLSNSCYNKFLHV